MVMIRGIDNNGNNDIGGSNDEIILVQGYSGKYRKQMRVRGNLVQTVASSLVRWTSRYEKCKQNINTTNLYANKKSQHPHPT